MHPSDIRFQLSESKYRKNRVPRLVTYDDIFGVLLAFCVAVIFALALLPR